MVTGRSFLYKVIVNRVLPVLDDLSDNEVQCYLKHVEYVFKNALVSEEQKNIGNEELLNVYLNITALPIDNKFSYGLCTNSELPDCIKISDKILESILNNYF